jgi:hypothetical protein
MTFSRWCRQTAAIAAAAVALAIGASQNAAWAQAKMPDEKQLAAQSQTMKAQLGFSDAQVKKFQAKQKTILSAYMPKLQAIEKKYGIKPGVTLPDDKKQKAQAEAMPLLREMTSKLTNALMETATPEQRAKMQQMQQQRQQGGGARPAAPKPAGR